MATSSRNTGGSSRKGAKKGTVSLIDADRELLDEKLGAARATGAAGNESLSGLFEALERFGLSSARVKSLRGVIDDMDVRDSVERAQEYLGEQIENARDYAKSNPGKVIGGAAGVLVGASLLAMALRRAGGEEKRGGSRPSSKKSRGASKSSGSKSSAGSKSGSSKGGKRSGSAAKASKSRR